MRVESKLRVTITKKIDVDIFHFNHSEQSNALWSFANLAVKICIYTTRSRVQATDACCLLHPLFSHIIYSIHSHKGHIHNHRVPRWSSKVRLSYWKQGPVTCTWGTQIVISEGLRKAEKEKWNRFERKRSVSNIHHFQVRFEKNTFIYLFFLDFKGRMLLIICFIFPWFGFHLDNKAKLSFTSMRINYSYDISIKKFEKYSPFPPISFTLYRNPRCLEKSPFVTLSFVSPNFINYVFKL